MVMFYDDIDIHLEQKQKVTWNVFKRRTIFPAAIFGLITSFLDISKRLLKIQSIMYKLQNIIATVLKSHCRYRLFEISLPCRKVNRNSHPTANLSSLCCYTFQIIKDIIFLRNERNSTYIINRYTPFFSSHKYIYVLFFFAQSNIHFKILSLYGISNSKLKAILVAK